MFEISYASEVVPNDLKLLRQLHIIVNSLESAAAFKHFNLGLKISHQDRRAGTQDYISAVLGAWCYLLYDALPYMVLRSCSAVLVEYLHVQLKTVQRCCKVKPSRNERKSLEQLEVIRHNMAKITDLKDCLNAIAQVPLATMSAGVLIFDCVVCYAMFNDGFFATDVPLALSYCVYSSFAFLDLAFASQALTDELRYLHKTIDPDGMCLSAGGFFRLNKSLLLTAQKFKNATKMALTFEVTGRHVQQV
ncbi:hypothetical protein IscW_ISCW011822 [Ixodes scapularis]|uniref:Gustatory receptor n=1 Tax=Ixodes scapularis TaxID=6945 RepID=B7Q4F7_IXOSC|nr:hypothetical protein IscW_ISCW011822 [Ixodes scapularis]|eukprot:XP_002411535.1 hypothetical protein IscW_ISCW011822 [Ixodes scapularis]